MLHLYQDKEGTDATDMQTVIIDAEPVECVVDQDKFNMSDYAPSYELLKTSGILQDIYSGPVINGLLPANKSGLHKVVSKLKSKLDGTEESFYQNMERNFETNKPTQVVHLEPMYETENALVQSWKYYEEGETIGEQYRAWQEAEDAKKRIKIGPDGQVTTTKETIKLVTGPDGKTYSVKVPADAFVEVDGEESDAEEDTGYNKYPCPQCKKTFKNKIMKVYKHMVKVHDMTMQEAKAKKKTIENRSVYVEGKPTTKSNGKGEFSNPVKPMEIKIKNFTLSSKIPVNLSDELNNFVTEKEEKEKAEETNDAEVDRKVMEFVNRRKVECRICSKKFSRTLLVRNHVAEEHLKLKKWTCAICEFGSWTKQHCLRHAEKAHRLRDIESGVIEQPREKYFDKNPLVKTSSTDTPSVDEADEMNVERDNSDNHSDHSGSTTTEDEVEHFERLQFNGLNNGKKSSTIVEGLQSRQLTSTREESSEGSDGDSEISFGRVNSAMSNPPLSPAQSPISNSVSPQSPSPIEINEPVKRKRGPSSSPRKPVNTVKRTKILNSDDDLVRDGMTDSSVSDTSILSKVPESKKTLNIVRRFSNTDEDVLIKDIPSMDSPITLSSDSRGSNSSRISDSSVTSSEVSSRSKGKARSRSSSISGSESNKSKSRAGSVSRKK